MRSLEQIRRENARIMPRPKCSFCGRVGNEARPVNLTRDLQKCCHGCAVAYDKGYEAGARSVARALHGNRGGAS